MINYDSGRFGFSLMFRLAGSVLPKILVVSFPCSLVCIALRVFLRDTLEQIAPDEAALKLLGGFTSMLGFLIVFRSNQAHNRWWEGCTLLLEIRAEWFNAYTSSLAFCKHDPRKDADTKMFQHQYARLMSLLYNCALQQITSTQGSDFELISLDGFDSVSMMFLASTRDRVEIVFQWVQKLIAEAAEVDVCPMPHPVLSRVFSQLGAGMNKVSNARKISEFPLPFPFAQLLSIMLILHSVFTIILCAVFVRQVFWSAALTFVIVGSFFGVNFIAVEIEAPFGDDANDLPLRGFARDMNEGLIELLDSCAQSVPGFELTSVARLCSIENAGELEGHLQQAKSDLLSYDRPTWSTLRNTHNTCRSSTETQSIPGPCAANLPFSGNRTCESSATVASNNSGKKRRNFVDKDSLAKQAAKTKSEARQNEDVFRLSALGRRTPSVAETQVQSAAFADAPPFAKMIRFAPEAPDMNAGDGDSHMGAPICPIVSGSAASTTLAYEKTPLSAEDAIDIGKSQNADTISFPRSALCLDADLERIVARTETHVRQTATNVAVMKEAIANAIVALEPHLPSPNTLRNCSTVMPNSRLSDCAVEL